MVIIYPVIELNDLVYAHRYGWLDALTKVTEGVMLRPEAALGPIFRSGVTIKGYLRARYGLPKEPLDRLKIMMDHGISGAGFREAFGLEKTPESLVKVYSRLRRAELNVIPGDPERQRPVLPGPLALTPLGRGEH